MRFDVIYCRADSTEHALYLLNRLIGNELIPKLISLHLLQIKNLKQLWRMSCLLQLELLSPRL